jgi:hypothetical protein
VQALRQRAERQVYLEDVRLHSRVVVNNAARQPRQEISKRLHAKRNARRDSEMSKVAWSLRKEPILENSAELVTHSKASASA